jgi:tRNA-modifying protein YgfZ
VAGLDRSAVSWSKGCYLGQEVVFMQDARGKLKRRLVPLAVPTGVPAAGAEVRSATDEVVGEVTSVAATENGAVVFARVRAPHYEPGTALSVAGFPAEVTPGPV